MSKSYDVYMCREKKPVPAFEISYLNKLMSSTNPKDIHAALMSTKPMFDGQLGTDKQIIRKTSCIQRIFGW